jgi:hypothetical protein
MKLENNNKKNIDKIYECIYLTKKTIMILLIKIVSIYIYSCLYIKIYQLNSEQLKKHIIKLIFIIIIKRRKFYY